MTTPPRIRPYCETDVPPELDGSAGDNRAPVAQLLMPLHNDREAMGYFLEQYAASAGTHRMYTRECERLGLWALHAKKKAISSLNVGDIEQYITFLGNPVPVSDWCGPKVSMKKPEWRPFVGSVDISARLTALSAINSMMGFWVQAGYVTGNPLGLFRQLKQKIVSGALDIQAPDDGKKKRAPRQATVVTEDAQKIERYLDDDMWAAAIGAVESLNPSRENDSIDTEPMGENPGVVTDHGGTAITRAAAQAEYERARFVMALMYLMAPRVGELQTHNMNSFREERGYWWWYVVGKGRKLAKVPVPDDMLQALIRYRSSLGLPVVPDPKDDSPLLRSVRHPGEPITARRLNQVLKKIFEAAALRLPAHAAHKADKLRSASAHWGRHTGITAKIDAGISHLHVQKDARHADFSTTQRYIHHADEARHADAQKQRLQWDSPQGIASKPSEPG